MMEKHLRSHFLSISHFGSAKNVVKSVQVFPFIFVGPSRGHLNSVFFQTAAYNCTRNSPVL